MTQTIEKHHNLIKSMLERNKGNVEATIRDICEFGDLMAKLGFEKGKTEDDLACQEYVEDVCNEIKGGNHD